MSLDISCWTAHQTTSAVYDVLLPRVRRIEAEAPSSRLERLVENGPENVIDY